MQSNQQDKEEKEKKQSSQQKDKASSIQNEQSEEKQENYKRKNDKGSQNEIHSFQKYNLGVKLLSKSKNLRLVSLEVLDLCDEHLIKLIV